ncbi:hypothetical protein AK812_SmicGene30269 [Symbiodinium microadriaticum]|uniref:Uncharacterized protein n=1 Tax=Symbiodinium microadriaticum TaxID=2951 RepID=A0A1Q9CZS7_SYMMI|nr:hypothetical protein AK812_SmicGene30269 [Symbiodinium microadriaticum]
MNRTARKFDPKDEGGADDDDGDEVRGWHKHVTCEERQRQETGRNAQYCPNCQAALKQGKDEGGADDDDGDEVRGWHKHVTCEERDDGSAADMGPDDDDGEDDESDRRELRWGEDAVSTAVEGVLGPGAVLEVIKTIATAPVQHRHDGILAVALG